MPYNRPGVISAGGTNPAVSASLPVSPADTTEVYLRVGSGDTAILWHMKYDSSITDTYKWRFLGGAPLYDVQNTTGTTSSNTYVTLNSSTPAVTLPGIGIYRFLHSCTILSGSSSTAFGIQNVQTNASGPADDTDAAQSSEGNAGTANQIQTVCVEFQRTVSSISGSAIAVAMYRTAATSIDFTNRHLTVFPVRLG